MRNLRKSYIYWDLDGTLWQHKEQEVKLICENLSIPYSIKLEEEFFYMIEEFNRHFETIRVTQSEICQIIERTMLELNEFIETGFKNKEGKRYYEILTNGKNMKNKHMRK